MIHVVRPASAANQIEPRGREVNVAVHDEQHHAEGADLARPQVTGWSGTSDAPAPAGRRGTAEEEEGGAGR